MRWVLLLIPTSLSALCPFTFLLGAALLGGGTAVWQGSFDFGAETLYWSTLSKDQDSFGWGARIHSSYVAPGGRCFMSVSGLLYRDDYLAFNSRTGRWLTDHSAIYFGGRYASVLDSNGVGPLAGFSYAYGMFRGEIGATALIGRRIFPGLDSRLSLHADACWQRIRIGGEFGVALEHYWHVLPNRIGFAGPFLALQIGF